MSESIGQGDRRDLRAGLQEGFKLLVGDGGDDKVVGREGGRGAGRRRWEQGASGRGGVQAEVVVVIAVAVAVVEAAAA